MRGREHLRGDPAEAEKLAGYLRVGEEEGQEAVSGLHALHPWPGRMHPLWARRIMADLPKDASVLDPFCGGGTVLVEARKLGLHARGSDINPIAVRLARLKCIPHADPQVVASEADRCFEKCTERRRTPFSALAQGETAFPKHVLAGLISLRDEIEKVDDRKAREILLFCMSPLLDKLAERQGRPAPRVPRTAVRDMFRRRVESWIAAWASMEPFRWAEVEQADAKWLPWKPNTSGALVTSPPYPGVYDYAGMQARRLRWLGGADTLATTRAKEIGRRDTQARWTRDMSMVLKQVCRTTRAGSPFYLVVGDGVMEDRVIRADRALETQAADLPMEFVAVASQERPHFHQGTARAFGKKPRMEHLIMFRRTEGPAGRQGQGPRPERRRKRGQGKRQGPSTTRARRPKK